MNRKRIAFILAMTISVGTLSAFPAGVSAAIDMSDLPEPISAEDTGTVKAFKKAKPVVTPEYEGYWGGLTLKWEPVDNALLYYVYQKNGTGKYKKIASVYDESFYTVSPDAGSKYAVKAVTFDYEDRAVYSLISDPVTYYPPEDIFNYEDGICTEEETVSMDSAGLGYTEVFFPENTEEYSHAEESAFKNASTDPVSTFSADVDTASYANLRRLINGGRDIPEDAVRIEEMLNYFDYNYVQPKGKSPFSVTYELSDCPWNKDSKLMMIGIQGRDIAAEDTPASNLVFLVDTSGSMWSENKLPLVKESINVLTETLTENDRISIVTYSGDEHVVLAGAKGNQTRTVKAMTECMDAGGSTNGEGGIRAAYDIAEHYFIEGGNNRVILATDGDLNVGISDTDELIELISEKRETGIYLTALGFGEDNLKDEKLEALADNGNGSYHYIDSAKEASKVLIEERSSTLFTIADDVKMQLEFNPAYIGSYRLIGYDNRRLNNEDFENDEKDAGDVGAGDSVTVLYELKMAADNDGSLKYQTPSGKGAGEWCTLKIRYKKPGATKSVQISTAIKGEKYDPYEKMSGRMKFCCAVTEFGMILKNSPYKGTSSISGVEKLLGDISPDDKTADIGYRDDFEQLIETYIENYDK
ncbi:MAG: VWA domain-containing protein [Oscillospiraceae bacterium]|nr:VWA domain-containing protein [Oscillospiraceae bacterium]